METPSATTRQKSPVLIGLSHKKRNQNKLSLQGTDDHKKSWGQPIDNYAKDGGPGVV